jgi:signal transduction histidine kinase
MWRRAFGLRPRLLAALVFTAVVTLVVAAVTLFGPLQDQLRAETGEQLEAAALAARPGIERDLPKGQFVDSAYPLYRRTDSRVLVYNAILDELFDSETGDSPPPLNVYRVFNTPRTTRSIVDDEVRVTIPLRDSKDRFIGIMEVRKPLTGVGETVNTVRSAFFTAALVGLLVAFVLGTGLARTLTIRLSRLREAAQRITTEGMDAPAPRDTARDEVGDLARALATMQEALRRQEMARRTFVSTASHELRTPLTLLSGMLELLDDDLREGRVDLDDAHEQISAAQRQLRRLEHLASDLLDLSRLDAEAPLRSEPVELGELTRAVGAEFALRAADRAVDVEVAPPIAPCWAKGDPGAVARIVRILIDNAVRFAPEGTPIEVIPGYHGERATVEVHDSGPGVPPAERERIFERFQRGSSTGGEEGFGLGLASGRELAMRLGGRLDLVDDGRPGATFVLSLPIELPAGSHREPEPVG